MQFIKKILKIFALFLGILLLFVIGFGVYVYNIADEKPPQIAQHFVGNIEQGAPVAVDTNAKVLGKNWIRKNEYGLYEMYVTGTPYQRGLAAGKLSQTLIHEQEVAFTHQLEKMIPSQNYQKFLKYIIGFMNRNLQENVTSEYQQEIYGISLSASDSFQWIGTKYSRLLNYHAAHDIGHALQNMMLVGCTSFGAWQNKTVDGAMILGRNFDFWVGDEFAKNKIVSFVAPDSGYKFASISWGGFIGVVSGMNEKGLTVTVNAAASKIPFGAATPVSLVAREILQYAKNIQEAVKIAHSRKMFVSESFMIGSAADKEAVVIEKTPDTMDVYTVRGKEIRCTNHYKSNLLSKEERNMEQMKNSASVYRDKRLAQLLEENYPLTVQKVANILRDQRGINNADIGYGNEKAINQLIAHHSIIFMPDSLRFWVSTSPWQLGTYVCYDLKKIFEMNGFTPNVNMDVRSLAIAPDTFLQTKEYADFLKFRDVKINFTYNKNYSFNTDTFLYSNPTYYDTYRILGDYFSLRNQKEKAYDMYEWALKKDIATEGERQAIVNKMNALK